MIPLAHLAALLALLGAGVVYGTDTFSALVLRPALRQVDDVALVAVMGNVHRYGDRRMPVPGVIGLVASAAAAMFAVLGGADAEAVTAGVALVLLVMWTVLYGRISAPINRVLTAASDKRETPSHARKLQSDWDRVIVLRATFQGLALLALGISLIIS
ncbi:DUF1772 domain-containing protein [Frondihabitans sp. VKM Ac-2883]|uniref:DUF1772 domain-containing protein n=1 Tax=Frondihabitans sp. VKM Ac-2883 TaxID=2783823 RepID=UPI00188DADBC|nr:DUF1772 domain-containing protein [Frondihabitans sp. VKM Ac-2883]MBF4577847.1 DUF1772 domain-containing protein [Frondihabitans sp. VKM Ac-2883]